MDIKAMLNGVGSPHARHEHHTLLPQDGPYVRVKCSCGVELSFVPVVIEDTDRKAGKAVARALDSYFTEEAAKKKKGGNDGS